MSDDSPTAFEDSPLKGPAPAADRPADDDGSTGKPQVVGHGEASVNDGAARKSLTTGAASDAAHRANAKLEIEGLLYSLAVGKTTPRLPEAKRLMPRAVVVSLCVVVVAVVAVLAWRRLNAPTTLISRASTTSAPRPPASSMVPPPGADVVPASAPPAVIPTPPAPLPIPARPAAVSRGATPVRPAAGPPGREGRPVPTSPDRPPIVVPPTRDVGTPPAATTDAPTPAAAMPSPAPAAPPSPPANGGAAALQRQEVDDVLKRYEQSFDRLDVSGVASIWRSVDRRELSRAFDSVRSQDMAFERCDISVVLTHATAHCSGTLSYVPRIGGSSQRVRRVNWTFELVETDTRWLIASVNAAEAR